MKARKTVIKLPRHQVPPHTMLLFFHSLNSWNYSLDKSLEECSICLDILMTNCFRPSQCFFQGSEPLFSDKGGRMLHKLLPSERRSDTPGILVTGKWPYDTYLCSRILMVPLVKWSLILLGRRSFQVWWQRSLNPLRMKPDTTPC